SSSRAPSSAPRGDTSPSSRTSAPLLGVGRLTIPCAERGSLAGGTGRASRTRGNAPAFPRSSSIGEADANGVDHLVLLGAIDLRDGTENQRIAIAQTLVLHAAVNVPGAELRRHRRERDGDAASHAEEAEGLVLARARRQVDRLVVVTHAETDLDGDRHASA